MARNRIYERWYIPKSVVAIVLSVCCDYERRQRAIERKAVTDAIRGEFERLNGIIDLALLDIEPGIRKCLLDDIAGARGYMNSPCSAIIAKNTYYNRKRKLIHDIAVGLNLIT